MIVAGASSMPKRHILEITSHFYDCFPNPVSVARLGPPRCEQGHARVVCRRVSNGHPFAKTVISHAGKSIPATDFGRAERIADCIGVAGVPDKRPGSDRREKASKQATDGS
jgi:hypothetical protein